MATLADLRQRIVDETNRDDLDTGGELAGALDRVIADAIDFYAAERWWFTEARVTSTTTAGNEYITRPAGTHIVDAPFLVVGGVRFDITKRSMEYLEGLYSVPQSGQPTDHAEYQDTLRLWPTPNDVYTIIWLNIADVTALNYAVPTSENAWTNVGAPLIAARSKVLLYRDYFRFFDKIPGAQQQEQEAYDRLKGETNRRLGTGRIRPSAL